MEPYSFWLRHFKSMSTIFSITNNVRSGHVEACTPELFHAALTSAATRQTWQRCQALARQTDAPDADLQALSEQYRKAKAQLPAFCFHASFADGRRKNESARPSGLVMIDLDHIQGDPREYYSRKIQGIEPVAGIVYAHLTPSGHGIHLVCAAAIPATASASEASEAIATAQQALVESLGIQEYFDGCTKDLARCSFVCPEEATLYLDEEGLFGANGAETAPVQAATALVPAAKAVALPVKESAVEESAVEECGTALHFKGIPFTSIIEAYWRRTGGEPVEGERNDRLHKLACYLRYITDNNEAQLLSIMPRYGLSEDEMRGLIHSACSGKLFSRPKLLQDILTELGEGKATDNANAIDPTCDASTNVASLSAAFGRGSFPPLISLLTSKVDAAFRPAVAMSIFAPLDTHLTGVTFRHITNEIIEPGCLSLLVAPFSSGKSSVNAPIDAIMRDIKQSDRAVRAQERAWREECSRLGSNKNKPPRPEGAIRCIQSNATAASFLDLLMRAQGKPLYTRCDEIELLDRFAGGRNGCATELVRVSFDHSEWGAERVSAASISGEAPLRLNMNVSTTPNTARRYLRRALTDGTLSRLTLSTIDRDPFAGTPQFGQYDEEFYTHLDSAIRNLNAASGFIECPECLNLIRQLEEETLHHAALTEDVLLLDLYKRALVSATRRAMTLYIAEGVWTAEIEAFVRWSYLYDIEVKRLFFGEDFLEARKLDNIVRIGRGPVNMLAIMTQPFTRQQLIEERVRKGMDPDPRRMLSTWKTRGYIEETSTPNTYRKLLI